MTTRNSIKNYERHNSHALDAGHGCARAVRKKRASGSVTVRQAKINNAILEPVHESEFKDGRLGPFGRIRVAYEGN
jgi:hypothetical protein